MANYGCFIPDANGNPIEMYLDSYVIDVLTLTNDNAGTKTYSEAKKLDAVIIPADGAVFGERPTVSYSGNKVTWSSGGKGFIIIVRGIP